MKSPEMRRPDDPAVRDAQDQAFQRLMRYARREPDYLASLEQCEQEIFYLGSILQLAAESVARRMPRVITLLTPQREEISGDLAYRMWLLGCRYPYSFSVTPPVESDRVVSISFDTFDKDGIDIQETHRSVDDINFFFTDQRPSLETPTDFIYDHRPLIESTSRVPATPEDVHALQGDQAANVYIEHGQIGLARYNLHRLLGQFCSAV